MSFVNEITETQIQDRALLIASEKGINPDTLSSAERMALEAEAKVALIYDSHPAVQEIEALRREVQLLKGQNETLQQAKATPVKSGAASFDAAQVRARLGQTFYGLSNDQKLRAAGINPAEVSLSEVRKLFGRGGGGPAALDLSRNAPGRYATLRQVAFLLDLNGR